MRTDRITSEGVHIQRKERIEESAGIGGAFDMIVDGWWLMDDGRRSI